MRRSLGAVAGPITLARLGRVVDRAVDRWFATDDWPHPMHSDHMSPRLVIVTAVRR